jgi:hypothetical protein
MQLNATILQNVHFTVVKCQAQRQVLHRRRAKPHKTAWRLPFPRLIISLFLRRFCEGSEAGGVIFRR